MRILFFDTETNGLPHVKKAPAHIVENWPRIVSIAWQVWEGNDTNLQMVEKKTFLIQPSNGVEWDTKSQEIHGISFERASMDGTPVEQVVSAFQESNREVDAIVCHNMEFDKPILLAEFHRLKKVIDWWPKIELCTMKHMTPVCKLPGRYPKSTDPYKYPTLTEMYSYLFGTMDTTILLHTAGGDVELLVQCFRELLRRDLLPFARLRVTESRLES